MDDVGWYRETRKLFVGALPSTMASARVPACPNWDVHDLVAHQVHQLEGACEGTFPVQDSVDAIVATEPHVRQGALARQERWIADGVRPCRTTPLDELVERWTRLEDDAPTAALVGLFPDVSVHLFDLLGAAGSAAYRDHPLLVPALQFWARLANARLKAAANGPVRLILVGSAGTSGVIGDADAVVTVEGAPFELLRAITSRRSRQQSQTLRWSNADEAAIEGFAVYGWRSEPLSE